MSSISEKINFTDNSTDAEWIALSAPKNPIWVCNTESPVVRIAKDILSILIFPIGLARVLHRVVGNFVVQSALMTKGYVILNCLCKIPFFREKAIWLKNEMDTTLLQYLKSTQQHWNVKRISIQVDGRIVDAVIVTQKDQTRVQKQRWTLLSEGNGEAAQFFSGLYMVKHLQSNAVFYNYPGVAGSTGGPSRSTIAKTSRVMLKFLEEVCDAKEVIWYGHSLGGGAQEAFSEHTQKEGVKYCLIKSRTFSHLSKVAQDMFGGYRIVAFFVRIFGWDMSPLASVQRQEAQQIILQTDPKRFVRKDPPSDGIITEEASLLKAVEEDVNPKCNGLFIQETHNEGFIYTKTFTDVQELVKKAGFKMSAEEE